MGLADYIEERWKWSLNFPVFGVDWFKKKFGNKLKKDEEKEIPIEIDDPEPKGGITIDYSRTTVNYSPRYIFNRSGPTRTPRLDPSFPQSPPEIPESRLPEVNDNQTPYKTPIGQSLTLKEALVNREYGRLLHRPINKRTLEVESLTSEYTDEKLRGDQEKAIQKLSEWYDAQQRAETPDNKIPPWDSALLFMPETLKGFQGDQGIVVGQEILHKMAETYAISSENSYQEVSCFVYPKIKVKEKKISLDREYKDSEENIQIVSFGTLSRLYYLVGGDFFKDGSIEFNFDSFLKEEIFNFWEDEDRTETKTFKIQTLFDYWKAITLGAIYRQGLDAFPNEVNETLFSFHDDPKFNRMIQSQADYFDWYVDSFDGLIGEWPIETEIVDTDLLQEGNQTEIVSHPNIAETLAEIFRLTRESAIQGDLAVNFLARLSCESVALKNLGAVNQSYLQSLYKALGFKSNRKRIRMKYNFNPKGATKVDDLLSESDQSVIGVKCEEKSEMWTYLENLMFAANIIKQVFHRNGDNSKAEEESIEKMKTKNQDKFDDDWEQLQKDIENQDSILNRDAIAKPDYKKARK